MPYDYSKGRYEHFFDQPDNVENADIRLNKNIGVNIERNLLTLATSRSGKGTCQIIPNLSHWKHNALVIDPKGEAAEATCLAREAMGRAVRVIDPFHTCNVPDRFRAKINLLDEINPDSPHAFRQINALADGMMMRHDPKAGHWDDGAKKVLAGFIAHVLTAEGDHKKSFTTVREWLTEPDGDLFAETIEAMARNNACGRLPSTAAAKLTKTGNEAGHFLSGATDNTDWLDDPMMADCLSESTFELSDLKHHGATVYLVLPFDALGDYGRFLRLFVRMALHHMMQKMPDGSLKGERCLFMLDEFYSLGHIDELVKAVGSLPGCNLHLWPFCQDYPQLLELYGKQGAGTFMSNSDWVFFYGVDDPETAQYVSDGVGIIRESDLQVRVPEKQKIEIPEQYEKGFWNEMFGVETPEYKEFRMATERPTQMGSWDDGNKVDLAATAEKTEKYEQARVKRETAERNAEAAYQDAMNQYAYAKSSVGHPRILPDEVMQFTARNEQRKIADRSIVLKQGDAFAYEMKAYFEH